MPRRPSPDGHFKTERDHFHHDFTLSGGQTHLRCVKVKELVYDAQGKIKVLGTS